jgi:hypothetical protein
MNASSPKPSPGNEPKSTPPGTRGYPEDTPRRNDKHHMPDEHTPHEHQNRPEQKPAPSR